MKLRIFDRIKSQWRGTVKADYKIIVQDTVCHQLDTYITVISTLLVCFTHEKVHAGVLSGGFSNFVKGKRW